MTKEERIGRQQEIVDGARDAGRGLTEDEQREFNELQKAIDAGDAGSGDENRDAGSGTDRAGEGDAAVEAERRAAVEAERRRNSDILELCARTGMDPQQYIRSGAAVEEVRRAAVEHLLAHGSPVHTGARDSERDSFREAARDALLIQAGVEVENPAEGAEEMRSMAPRDMLIECMSRSGGGSVTSLLRMSRDDLWNEAVRQFMSPTADFPAILDAAVKKAIVHEYANTPETFEAWTGRGSLPDFKPTKDHEYVLGGGEFRKVPEGGELKASYLETELLPSRKLDTYGTQFTMTRQAFINDDIGFISEMPGQYTRKAKQKINKDVYEMIFKNPTIFDGMKLFNEAHKNHVTTGAVPDMAGIQKLITMFGLQTDQFGESIMVAPANIIVPVGWGTKVEQILATAEIEVEGIGSHTVNMLHRKYQSRLRVIEEGVLNVLAGQDACPWFMTSDPRQVKGVQVDYLNGKAVPSFRRSEKAGFLGYIWDIWIDWGINVRDFRGLARNDGAKIVL